MELHGLHHVTSITAQAAENVKFYTQVLGLRLVKKTVNQDDVSAYHLFYADAVGSPGTDITFFDWPRTAPARPGTDRIARTYFRVRDQAALDFWVQRLAAHSVSCAAPQRVGATTVVRFADFEGQPLALAVDDDAPIEGELWRRPDIPNEHALRGFHSVELSVPSLGQIEPVLTHVLNMKFVGGAATVDEPAVFTMADGGPGKLVWVIAEPDAPRALSGRGAVHHVAFRIADATAQAAWVQHLRAIGVPNSGPVDRFWFTSIYFRATHGILFEIATDGPGFAVDEAPAELGTTLVLPPFLEGRRKEIEAGLRPLPT